MAINWDFIINAVILIGLGIWFLSAVTKQTVPELIHSIKDIINGTGESALEKGEELLYYD
jgi:hypothetical protein